MRSKTAVVLVIGAFLLGAAIALVSSRALVRRGAPQILGTATVVQQIQSLSELVTVKYVMQKPVVFTAGSSSELVNLAKQFGVPGTADDTVTLVFHGIAKAGVDLGKVQPSDVDATGRSISVRIPKPVVTDVYIDESQTQVLDRKKGLFRNFDTTLELKARQYARSELSRAARQNGIEREAEQRAREQLEKFFQTLGFTNVTVTAH
jgi:hypothetical protein